MIIALIFVVVGLIALVWSADIFVGGSSATAKYFKVSPLIVGIVIVGFGTSAPEMAVSVSAALQGNAGIAIGNAFGSNIANIAFILGSAALVSPILVRRGVLKKELPFLLFATILAVYVVWDLNISRVEGLLLIAVFAVFMFYNIRSESKKAKLRKDEVSDEKVVLSIALVKVIAGLVILIVSSRFFVHGAVTIARIIGVSDTIIGLTVVAVGTSLPELASSISAVRKGEDELAFGNIVGSNLFNTLMVVGLAGALSPFAVQKEILARDSVVLVLLTLGLFAVGYSRKGDGKVMRYEGALLVTVYIAYIAVLIKSVLVS